MSIDFDLVWNKAFGKSRGKKLLKDIFQPFQTISKSFKHIVGVMSFLTLSPAVHDQLPAVRVCHGQDPGQRLPGGGGV